jgi:hypothetical protein
MARSARKASSKARGGTRAKSEKSSTLKVSNGAKPALAMASRRLDAMPDRVDVRDWFYQPTLAPLPDVLVNIDRVPRVLDQGQEGACTGFALAAVVNFLLHQRYNANFVSPRMLYEMARRYDEWPGEDYEGSSARGAMKGWVRHGACVHALWSDEQRGPDHLTDAVADDAKNQIGGAYYRVSHRDVRDMHAALSEVGILYCTLMVHAGWDNPDGGVQPVSYIVEKSVRRVDLPIIRRVKRANDGHAIAILGYTREGFVVQNSWGESWGHRGFALLPYEDFMMHATDVWAAQLGVPIASDLWETRKLADTTAGLHRAAPVIPLADIRPFVVDVGNNGELSDSGQYFTTRADVDRLFKETIPERTKSWSRKRIALYLHGGLNKEDEVARRILAFRNVMLENEIYPIHIMWESGFSDALRQMIGDLFTDVDDRAGGIADWLRKTRDGLIEAKDRTLELTAAGPGSLIWDEMKENARLSSEHPDKLGAMQIMAQSVAAAFAGVSSAERKSWELHVVGHSAGSIYGAYAMPHLIGTGVALKTIQFMAPAMTVELFEKRMAKAIAEKSCPMPHLYILSNGAEEGDSVGPYGKSLLYLVSNAFEGRREVPLLGMQKFVAKVDGKDPPDPKVAALVKGSVTVAKDEEDESDKSKPRSNSDTHGGFDNDAATMNSVLRMILGGKPKREFLPRDLQF